MTSTSTTSTPSTAAAPTTETTTSLPAPVARSTTDAELVWVGVGEAFRYDGGQWIRVENLDYEFEVHQVRTGREWKSTKNLHRTVAGYDGSAGEREQVLRFALRFSPPDIDGNVAASVDSNIGLGNGVTDSEFREASFTLTVAEPTPLYNGFRITQRYSYEDGLLTEIVDLFQQDPDGTEHPAFQMRERAVLFAATTFDRPPTIAA